MKFVEIEWGKVLNLLKQYLRFIVQLNKYFYIFCTLIIRYLSVFKNSKNLKTICLFYLNKI